MARTDFTRGLSDVLDTEFYTLYDAVRAEMEKVVEKGMMKGTVLHLEAVP